MGFPGLRFSLSDGSDSHDFVHSSLSVALHKFFKLFVVIPHRLSRGKVYQRNVSLFGGTELGDIGFVKDSVLLSRHLESEGSVRRFH